MDEKSKLKADLQKTQSELLLRSQAVQGAELQKLEKQMESAKLQVESVKNVS